jgi:hypothetical protein
MDLDLILQDRKYFSEAADDDIEMIQRNVRSEYLNLKFKVEFPIKGGKFDKRYCPCQNLNRRKRKWRTSTSGFVLAE